jgi:hypothetical protein
MQGKSLKKAVKHAAAAMSQAGIAFAEAASLVAASQVAAAATVEGAERVAAEAALAAAQEQQTQVGIFANACVMFCNHRQVWVKCHYTGAFCQQSHAPSPSNYTVN